MYLGKGSVSEKTTSHRVRPWSGQQIATGVIENGVDIKKLWIFLNGTLSLKMVLWYHAG